MRIYSLIPLSLLLFSSCHHQKEPSKNQEELSPVKVQVTQATIKKTPSFEPVVGTVRPLLSATLSSDIPGRILKLAVVSGQQVKKGDIIARIEAKELEASRMRAEAALQQAELELTRQKRLIKKNATSRSRYEQAVAAERMARASLNQIIASLEKSTVRAPFDGTISRKFADEGDLASPGRPLVKIEAPNALRLEAPVAESLAGALHLGQKIHVEITAVNLHIDGKIGELEPSADAATRTFLVKINLPPSPKLRAGLFGRALIPQGEKEQLTVPASCLVKRGQMEVMFVRKDGKAQLRLVRTVPLEDDQLSVLSGIANHEEVVINPPAELRDGTPLTLAK